MLKPARSPVLGYNHNVRYRGRVFHVQTEDSGPVNPRIFTHLYFGGTILASKRHEYDAAAAADVVRALMQSQHKSILRDLKAGRHDAQLVQFFSARGEPLDVVTPGQPVAGEDLADVLAAEKTPTPVPVSLSVSMSPAAVVALTTPTPAPVSPPPTVTTPPAPAARSTHFSTVFEDEPTDPEHTDGRRAHEDPPLPQPVAKYAPTAPTSTPALGSSVHTSRIIPLGGSTPTPTPIAQVRPRRPAPSIPYVVQEGSHPVAPAPAAARAEAPPPMPLVAAPVPLVPAPIPPQNAPLTAATVGATPTQVSTREDSQSLDEVIMAYLSRG